MGSGNNAIHEPAAVDRDVFLIRDDMLNMEELLLACGMDIDTVCSDRKNTILTRKSENISTRMWHSLWVQIPTSLMNAAKKIIVRKNLLGKQQNSGHVLCVRASSVQKCIFVYWVRLL